MFWVYCDRISFSKRRKQGVCHILFPRGTALINELEILVKCTAVVKILEAIVEPMFCAIIFS